MTVSLNSLFYFNSTKILNFSQMNLGLHLYNYLQEKGSAELPGFGVFYTQEKISY